MIDKIVSEELIAVASRGIRKRFGLLEQKDYQSYFEKNKIESPTVNSEGIFIINVDGSGLQKILSNGSDMTIWH